MNSSRRSFLRGHFGQKILSVRPPWSLPESQFNQRCSRCGDCVEVCETGVLQKGEGGFPEARFNLAGCNYCGKCVQKCTAGAFHPIKDKSPWQQKAIISLSCLARQKIVCRTCEERCEAGAIHFKLEKGGVAIPLLDLTLCNGCGMCVADCPSHAITLKPTEHVEETSV